MRRERCRSVGEFSGQSEHMTTPTPTRGSVIMGHLLSDFSSCSQEEAVAMALLICKACHGASLSLRVDTADSFLAMSLRVILSY